MPKLVAAAFITYRELSFKPRTPVQEMQANQAAQFFRFQMGFSIQDLMAAHAQRSRELSLE